jgi:hypothetical protein
MDTTKLTGWLTLTWVVAAIGYDYLAYRLWGSQATISHVLRMWSDGYPVLLIALGCLIWHLFGKGQ